MSGAGDQAIGYPPMDPVHDGTLAVGRDERLTVSLKTLARQLDAHRSSVRRWLNEAGIHPIALGRGRNAGIRYRWRDIERWLETRQHVS